MKEARHRNNVYVAVVINLTMAFDCLKHDLLITKLRAFGFDYKSFGVIRVIGVILNNRVQVIKFGSYVMHCAIWYHLNNLKNVKNTHGRVLILVQPATILKLTLLHGCFSRF